MFNSFLSISPFVYGGSFIFAVLLMRLRCYKYVIFPAYIVLSFILIHAFYKGNVIETEFKIYTIFLNAAFALTLLVGNFGTKKLIIMLSPALTVFVMFFANLYYYLLSFYAFSFISVVIFTILVLQKIHKRKKIE